MEVLIEIIIDLLFDFGVEAVGNKKISKWVRYPLLGLIFLTIILISGGLIIFGISLASKSFITSLVLILLGMSFLFVFLFEIRKVYLEKKQKSNEQNL